MESVAGSHQLQPRREDPINQHDVVPILLLRCTTCHGPSIQQGSLDLRTRAAALEGGASGPAFIPRDPDKSLMIQLIESEACPPRGSLLKFFVRRPPNSEVEILRKWDRSGCTGILHRA